MKSGLIADLLLSTISVFRKSPRRRLASQNYLQRGDALEPRLLLSANPPTLPGGNEAPYLTNIVISEGQVTATVNNDNPGADIFVSVDTDGDGSAEILISPTIGSNITLDLSMHLEPNVMGNANILVFELEESEMTELDLEVPGVTVEEVEVDWIEQVDDIITGATIQTNTPGDVTIVWRPVGATDWSGTFDVTDGDFMFALPPGTTGELEFSLIHTFNGTEVPGDIFTLADING